MVIFLAIYLMLFIKLRWVRNGANKTPIEATSRSSISSCLYKICNGSLLNFWFIFYFSSGVWHIIAWHNCVSKVQGSRNSKISALQSWVLRYVGCRHRARLWEKSHQVSAQKSSSAWGCVIFWHHLSGSPI